MIHRLVFSLQRALLFTLLISALATEASAQNPATILTIPLAIPSNSQPDSPDRYNLVLYLIPSEDFTTVIERAVIERENTLEIDSKSEELFAPSYLAVTQKEVQEIPELQGQPFTQQNLKQYGVRQHNFAVDTYSSSE